MIYVNGSPTLGSYVKRFVKQKMIDPIGVKTTKKILGVNWDLDNDKFLFKFDKIVSFASTLTVTKTTNKICILKTGWVSEVPVEVVKN